MVEMKYLIVSMENDCVFTFTPRDITACALTEGDIDSVAVGLTYATSPVADYNFIKNRDQFYNKIYQYNYKTGSIAEVAATSVSEQWKATQDVIRLRQEALFLWESLTANAALKSTKYKWDGFEFIAYSEIEKCTSETYTEPVQEYARILEMTVEEAHKELKLQIETDIIKKFRIQALSEKWKRKINQCYTSDEIDQCKKQMHREFVSNGNL